MVMFNPISSSTWKPVDGLELEKAAEETVFSSTNFYVIAGPGAGKTELLAQRACYLLQTDKCRNPRRILAISLKKDAARNIYERVNKRCGDDLSRRFISLTYDSFAKQLLDHFRKSLPEEYIPSFYYNVEKNGNKKIVDTLRELRKFGTEKLNNEEIQNLHIYLTSVKLPISTFDNSNINEVILKIWQKCLEGDSTLQPTLTFSMISRLSEYLIRSNPKIRSALVATYSHIFLDEFQDTTTIQYDLIKTCFLNTDCVLTAVGDEKQRIMEWAGADREIFNKFCTDFGAEKRELLINYRSAPRLVEIQNVLMKNLNSGNPRILTSKNWNENDGICEVWNFKNSTDEAATLSQNIFKWIKEENIACREICIIVRQKIDSYCSELINCLKELGVNARNETKFQELLSEEVVTIILDILKITFSDTAREEWENIIEFLASTNNISLFEESSHEKLGTLRRDFYREIAQFKSVFSSVEKAQDIEKGLWDIINYVGKSNLIIEFPQYKDENYLIKIVKQLAHFLWEELSLYQNWIDSIESLEGNYSVPIMTIHKSKGLEYDTVIFIGLEDSAFWNFINREEETCGFFVAFSRAKRRVIFTYSEIRAIGFNGKKLKQRKKRINSLYSILNKSEIVKVKNY